MRATSLVIAMPNSSTSASRQDASPYQGRAFQIGTLTGPAGPPAQFSQGTDPRIYVELHSFLWHTVEEKVFPAGTEQQH